MIAIHQPNYLPWLGFFDKARIADKLVLLDNVAYTRGGVGNRNRIRTKKGLEWITVPVHYPYGAEIKDVQTVDSGWEETHWKTLFFNYHRAPYFNEVANILQPVYQKRWHKLAEVNETLIRLILKYLGLSTKIFRSSELEVEGKSSELLVSICKAAGDREYLSGVGATGYLDVNLFEREGISVRFQLFRPPEYAQRFGDFIPNLSAVDYLFNCGARSWS